MERARLSRVLFPVKVKGDGRGMRGGAGRVNYICLAIPQTQVNIDSII